MFTTVDRHHLRRSFSALLRLRKKARRPKAKIEIEACLSIQDKEQSVLVALAGKPEVDPVGTPGSIAEGSLAGEEKEKTASLSVKPDPDAHPGSRLVLWVVCDICGQKKTYRQAREQSWWIGPPPVKKKTKVQHKPTLRCPEHIPACWQKDVSETGNASL